MWCGPTNAQAPRRPCAGSAHGGSGPGQAAGSGKQVGGMENLAALELVQHVVGRAQVGMLCSGCRAVVREIRMGKVFPDQREGRKDRDFLQRRGLGDQHVVELFLEVAGALAVVARVVPLDAQFLGDVFPVRLEGPMGKEPAASMQQDRQRGQYEQGLPQGFCVWGKDRG